MDLDQAGEDVFRQAIMDHALSLGMDPERDAGFLWLAEEALTAELPDEWEPVESDGQQYYYNRRTGQSSWENPLDEPYRRLFLKLRNNPEIAREEKQRRSAARNWNGSNLGAGSISKSSAAAQGSQDIVYADRERKMAEELGLHPLDLGEDPPSAPGSTSSSGGVLTFQGSQADGYTSSRTSAMSQSNQPSIVNIIDHRAATMADGEVDMQYLAEFNDGNTNWFSANTMFSEVPDLIHEYNNGILASRAQATKSLEVQLEEERARVAALKRILEEERTQSAKELQELREELDTERRNALDNFDSASHYNSASKGPRDFKEREAMAQQLEDMASAKRSVEHALSQVKQELNEEIASNLASRKQVVALEAELEQAKRQCDQAQADHKAAKQRAQEAERRLRDRSFANSPAKSRAGGFADNEDEDLESEIQRLRTELSQKSNECLEATEALEASKRQLNRAANERDVVQTALDKVKVELDLEFKTTARLRQDAQQAQDRADTLERELQISRHDLNTVLAKASPGKSTSPSSKSVTSNAEHAEVKSLRQEISTLQDKLSHEKSEALNTQERLYAAERRATRAENERDVLQKALTQVKAELQQEFTTSAGLRQEAQKLQDKVDSHEREIQSLRDELQDVQNASKKNDNVDDDATRKLEDLQNTIHKLRDSLRQKDSELDDTHANLLAAQEQAQSATRSRDRDAAEREVLENSARTAKEDLARESALAAQMRRELTAAQVKIEEMGKQAGDKEAHEQQLADMDMKLRRSKEKVRTLEQTLARCKDEMDTVIRAHDARTGAANEERVRDLEEQLRERDSQMQRQTEAVEQKAKKIASLEHEIEVIRSAETIDPMELERTKQELAAASERLAEEIRKRRAIHNKLVDLQGNIRVYCRVRPVLVHETKSGRADVVVRFPNEGEIKLLQSLSCRDQEDAFEFDQVFQPTAQQSQVFSQVEPLVQSALDGYNVCIFAYGQTGSGKTYTMDGTESDRGVIHRTFETLFQTVEERKGLVEYAVEMSMLEIYNETIRDLFAPPVDPKQLPQHQVRRKLEVRQGQHGLHVPGLEQVSIDNLELVEQLMKKGIQNRTVGQHNVNQHSSRSHLVVTITLVAKHETFVTRSKLNLIDLAGSERLDKTNASGGMLTEAKAINKSLSALGNVIQALGNEKKDHVPFRDSKLTYLLQDSLCGTSKVLMFVNVSPVEWNSQETLCSLTFAQRCRRTQLGQAVKQKQ